MAPTRATVSSMELNSARGNVCWNGVTSLKSPNPHTPSTASVLTTRFSLVDLTDSISPIVLPTFSSLTPPLSSPNAPYNNLRLHRSRAASSPQASYLASPDHYPVSLSFVSTLPSKKRSTNIPHWLISSPLFTSEFRSLWTRSLPGSGFAAAAHFKRTIITLASSISYFTHNSSSSNQIRVLSAAVSLLRALNAQREQGYVSSLIQRHPELHVCLLPNTNTPSYSLTSLFINKLLFLPVTSPTMDILTPKPTTHPSHNNNMINFIKTQLPTDRKKLTHLIPYAIDDELRDDDDPLYHHTLPITDPVEMANHIALYWGKIWEARPDPPSKEETQAYLASYLRRIPQDCIPSFPNRSHQAICPALDMSWTELITRSIDTSNDSSPGPDGIPFAAYRALSEYATPFLLDIRIESARGAPPPPRLQHGPPLPNP